MHHLDDVITAIATPPGEGGIAVIRLSGEKSFRIADLCFRGKKPLSGVQSHTAHFGEFVNRLGEKIDDVIATAFRSPHSYTGEDTVEISCHGGLYVARRIVETLIDAGARQAEPGEFTKRAFLNGRMDLSQAEAVADLIHAQSESARRQSLSQLHGRLSHKVDELREKLLSICSLLELELDFAEEGLSLVPQAKVAESLNNVSSQIDLMLNSYATGRLSREGVSVVIVGEPNVGKSSIFNSLIDFDRSIVTPIAGTTRDSIEESITIGGVLFRLVDTAGIRTTADIVETEGIRRTYSEIEKADLILFVRDSTRIDEEVFAREIQELQCGDKKVIEVFNKFDLVGFQKTGVPLPMPGVTEICVSAETGFGVKELRDCLGRLVGLQNRSESGEGVMVTSHRHVQCLRMARAAILSSLSSLENRAGNELISSDIRAAVNELEMIVGKVTSDDILNHIFSSFCFGK